MKKTEKLALIRIIQMWMSRIQASLSNDWALSEVERYRLAGKLQAYKEILDMLSGKVGIGVPTPKKKKDKT